MDRKTKRTDLWAPDLLIKRQNIDEVPYKKTDKVIYMFLLLKNLQVQLTKKTLNFHLAFDLV